MSILLAVTVTPKSCISAYPLLTALGKVSDKLHAMYDWDDRLVAKIKEACKAKNERINEMGLFQSFFNTMGTTLVTRSHSDDPNEVSKVAKELLLYIPKKSRSYMIENIIIL